MAPEFPDSTRLRRQQEPIRKATAEEKRMAEQGRAFKLVEHADLWAEAGKTETGERQFAIASESGKPGDPRAVRIASRTGCTCPRFVQLSKRYGSAAPCKHMIAVTLYLERADLVGQAEHRKELYEKAREMGLAE